MQPHSEVVRSAAKECRPDNAAGGIEEEKPSPIHSVRPGQDRGEHAQNRDEAAEEHDLAAMPLKQVEAEFQFAFGQSDAPAVAQQQAVSGLASDPVSGVVAHDGAGCRNHDDEPDVQLVGGAGIDCRQNQHCLAGKRDSHALERNGAADAPIAVCRDQPGQISEFDGHRQRPSPGAGPSWLHAGAPLGNALQWRARSALFDADVAVLDDTAPFGHFRLTLRSLAQIGYITSRLSSNHQDKMTKTYRIAVIPGDGIGKEVVPEGVRALEAAGKRFGFALDTAWFDFASCDYYEKHGRMMPPDWKERIGGHDAIFFGAVGWPAKVPDHISLWGSLVMFRREFDQYINLRPVRLMPGVASPLANRQPGDIDFYVVRENTEGEYSSVGGRMFAGTEREAVVQEAIFTRIGVDRVLKYAFELGRRRPQKHLTSCTKPHGIPISMPYWDERVVEMAKSYSDVKVDKFHVDILSAHFVRNPHWFDVVVASNLFGDILSDLGPACTGTIAIAPSGNINPERKFPSMFEPVHGSAPDIAGQGIANPIGQIWSGAMMLDHLGYPTAHDAIVRAIERITAHGPRTPDMGGRATTTEVGRAVAEAL